MGLFGLFGKKVILQCTCGCGCRDTFDKYGRRTMDTYASLAIQYGTKWKGDYEICMDCNAGNHTNATVSDKKSESRKGFSKETERTTFEKQGGKCNICKKTFDYVNGRPIHPEYDHIDGNPSNNDPSNCQVLCLDCHRSKTVRDRKTKK